MKGATASMVETYSRRSFLSGVLACGTLTAATTWFIPGGRPETDPTKKVVLRLATNDSAGTWNVLTQFWNEQHPEVEVKVTERSGQTDDVNSAMYDQVKSRQADIVNLDVIHIAKFYKDDLIEPVRLISPNTFLGPALASSRIPGETDRYWAAPFYSDVGMLFSRAPANGEPSLAEVIDRLCAERARDLVLQLSPVDAGAAEPFVVNVWEQALARDDGLVGEDGCPSLDLNRWRAALEPIRNAMAKERILNTPTEPQSLEQFKTTARSTPNSERPPLFMRNWPATYRDLQKVSDGDVMTGKIRVMPLIGSRGTPIGVLGGRSLALVKGSPNKEQAQQFIDFATGLPAQKTLTYHGLVSPRVGVYNDPNLAAIIPHLNVVRRAIEHARLRPITHTYAEFSQAVREHVGPFLTGRGDLTKAFITDIQKAVGC